MGTVTLDEQRRRALRTANDIRRERAVMKRELREGSATARDLLTDVPICLRTMRIHDFLRAQPGIGATKGNRICQHLRVRPSRYLGELSPRVRAEIILSIEALLLGRVKAPT